MRAELIEPVKQVVFLQKQILKSTDKKEINLFINKILQITLDMPSNPFDRSGKILFFNQLRREQEMMLMDSNSRASFWRFQIVISIEQLLIVLTEESVFLDVLE